MNTQSVDCRRVSLPAHIKEAGDFCILPGMAASLDATHLLLIRVPGASDNEVLELKVGAQGSRKTFWGWSGDSDRPTVTPSILRKDIWHGYLTNGRLQSC